MSAETTRQAWVDLAPAEVVYERVRGGAYDTGSVHGMPRLIGAHPRLAQAFGALFSQVMFASGALDRREREMVAGVASAAQDCTY